MATELYNLGQFRFISMLDKAIYQEMISTAQKEKIREKVNDLPEIQKNVIFENLGRLVPSNLVPTQRQTLMNKIMKFTNLSEILEEVIGDTPQEKDIRRKLVNFFLGGA